MSGLESWTAADLKSALEAQGLITDGIDDKNTLVAMLLSTQGDSAMPSSPSPASRGTAEVQLRVKWKSKEYDVGMRLGNTVRDLKERLFELTNVLVSDQRLTGLMCGGAPLRSGDDELSFLELDPLRRPHTVTLTGESIALPSPGPPQPAFPAVASREISPPPPSVAARIGRAAGGAAGPVGPAGGGRPMPAATAAQGPLKPDIKERYQSVHGKDHPDFFLGPFEEAFKTAVFLRKLLVIYLHSERGDFTSVFCSNVLTGEELQSFLRNNCIFWAYDMTKRSTAVLLESSMLADALSASAAFEPVEYPYVAIASCNDGRLVINSVLQGFIDVDELYAKLTEIHNTYEPIAEEESRLMLDRDDRERKRLANMTDAERRVYEQQKEDQRVRDRLRADQEAAFAASLAADREKAERAQQEQERAARAVEDALAAERRREEEERRTAESEKARMDVLRQAVPPEPSEGTAGAVSVVIRLPSGERLQRRFMTADTIGTILAYLHVEGQPDTNFATNYPRRTFTRADADLTLAAAGLTQRVMLFVEASS